MLRATLFLLFLFHCRLAQAWPLILHGVDVPALLESPFDQIRAFQFDATARTWVSRPVQTVQTNAKGRRDIWNPEYAHPHRERYYKNRRPRTTLGLTDEILLNPSDFTTCNEACIKAATEALPQLCPTRNPVYRIVPPMGGTIFLARCSGPAPTFTCPHKVDLDKRVISTSAFDYRYTQDNHMLIEDLGVRGKDGTLQTMLRNSKFDIHANPKYLPFDLHFDSEEIRSRLVSVSCGPVAAIAEIEFELHILLFKVSLDLLSQVVVFADGVHVPAIVTLPMSGDRLKPPSGVFYGFHTPFQNVEKDIETDIPFLKGEDAPIPFAPRRHFLLKEKGRWIAANVELPSYFAEMAFSPALATPDMLAARKFPRPEADFGIFYDVTRLKKGEHKMAAWFYAGHEDNAGDIETLLQQRRPRVTRVR